MMFLLMCVGSLEQLCYDVRGAKSHSGDKYSEYHSTSHRQIK